MQYLQPPAKNGTFISIWLIDATQLNHMKQQREERKNVLLMISIDMVVYVNGIWSDWICGCIFFRIGNR